MKPELLFWLLLGFNAALMLAVPHLSPRGLLFAVRTGAGHPSDEERRAALKLYRWSIVAALAAGAAVILAVGSEHQPVTLLLASLLPEFAGFFAFARNHFHLRAQAAPAEGAGDAGMALPHDRLPWWTIFALPPFLFPAGVMVYLNTHSDQIPLRYPVHYGASGEPNRWATRTALGVDAPLLFALGLMLLLLFLGAATFYGARRSKNRSAVLAVMIGVMYLLSLIFSGIGLSPLMTFPMWAAIGLTPLFVVVVLAVAYWRSTDPAQSLDTTPDECWTLGGIYHNPRDPALFVPKRIGWGYTFNFGNRWSWVVLGGFAAGIGGLSLMAWWTLK